MANYDLVINSKFQPFSYERYMQPIIAYDNAFKQLEEQYGNYVDKAAALDKLKDSSIDQDSYNKYKEFMNTIESSRDLMYKNGMSGADRMKLMQARRDFNGTIIPLQSALEKREKEALLQYETRRNNPYIKFSREANETPLSQYINGIPNIQVIDGTKLNALAAQMATPIANRLLGNEDEKKKLKEILPYQYREQLDYGISPSALIDGLAEAAKGNPNGEAARYIKYIQDTILEQSGLNMFSETKQQELRPWALSMINSGLSAMIGKSTKELFKDDFSADVMKKRLERPDTSATDSNNIIINPQNIYTKKEESTNKTIEESFNKYLKHFITTTKEGHEVFTQNGVYHIKAAKVAKKIKSYVEEHKETFKKKYNNKNWRHFASLDLIKEFATKEGLKYYDQNEEKKLGYWEKVHNASLRSYLRNALIRNDLYNSLNAIGFDIAKGDLPTAKQVMDKIRQALSKSYDATKRTEFKYDLEGTSSEVAKRRLINTLTNKDAKLYEANFDGIQNTYTRDTENYLTYDTLYNDKDNKYKVVAVTASPYGNTIEIQGPEGVKKYVVRTRDNSYLLSPNVTRSKQIANIVNAIGEMQEMYLRKGIKDPKTGKTTKLIEEELRDSNERYRNSLLELQLYMSGLFTTNESKAQEFKPTGGY